MDNALLKIIPIILLFVLGYALKRINFLTKEHADFFLKLVVYVTLPALIMTSVIKIALSLEFLFFFIIPFIVVGIMGIVAYVIGSRLQLSKATMGTFLVGCMIMNGGFTFPFVIAAFGQEGIARFAVFDATNALIVFSFVYFIACLYGSDERNIKRMIKKALLLPPTWALLLAIGLNIMAIPLPAIAEDFFNLIGTPTTVFIMLALGAHFSPTIITLPIVSGILIRMGLGFLLGIGFISIFHLEGINKVIILISTAAPAGYNTLIFSSLEKLDTQLAAGLVSFSILIGMIVTPLLIVMLQ